jgi:hypothetical protein
MSTIPSLALIPSGYKASKVYSVLPTDGSGDLTFTRAADTATRVNSDGLIESVLANIPRLDYLNSSCPRLLLEPQRTNLFLYSEQLNNAGWTKGASGTGAAPVVTANYAISPDGYQNADRVQFDAVGTTDSDRSSLHQNFAFTSGQVYTISAYAKSATGSNQILQFRIAGAQAGGELTATSEWQRFSVTYTATTSTTDNFGIQLRGNNTETTSDLLLYGLQLELASYATSYIGPTLGAAVTRGGDNCSTTSLQSASLIGATAGTFFLQTTKTDNAFWFNQRIFLTSTTVRSLLMDNSGGQIRLRTWDAASAGATITTSGLANGLVKYLIKWDGTNIKVFANGVLQGSSAQPSYAYTTYTAYESTSFSNNSISQLLFFPTALSDADCIALTA